MKINFFGFNESTTVGEIRARYADIEKCDELNNFRAKFASKGLFDAIFYILLGGASTTKNACSANYMKKVNTSGPWDQNVKKHTTGKNSNTEVTNLIGTISERNTLADVCSKLEKWSEWESDKRKEKFLNALKGGKGKMNSNGNVQEKNIDDLVSDNIKNNKQIIFTGAPGTGKTWSVRKYVEDATKKDESRYKFVQFHSSYDYTDFVEGLRPVPDENGGNMFVRMDGTFKAFCREIVKANLDELKDKGYNFSNIDDYYNAMKDDEKKEKICKILDTTPYYFIIDEINRADLSKVFGELMFGLEESYRGPDNKFDTQYKNLPTYQMNENGKAEEIKNDCFKDGFFVPENLHIIGTMNDIDRSVESFDFALRRRFVWVDVKANEIMFESLKAMCKSNLSDDKLSVITENIINMNNAISNAGLGLTQAYHIGPAYFKELVKVSDDKAEDMLKVVYENRIKPILFEYTRGRRSGVQELLETCKNNLLGE